ncbi:glycosyltransferase family 2 protein [Methanobrevibacter sp.]|uniref:glycosyltransferase family 2 protein n=1 Tax=Methanobrevibacter sp. TaxID=66852 RepID=UPI003870B7B8
MVKVSVIIPFYNVEEYLKECLDSVVNQTMEDIEIICINDGSTDNSMSILNTYDDERIKIIEQENQGLSSARNVGLENSNGDYICFLDSDDYLEITALEEIYEIAQDKSLDLLMFKLINFDNDTGETEIDEYYEMEKLKKVVGDNIFSYEDTDEVFFDLSVTAPAKLFKHDLIKDLRFPEYLIYEDNAFYMECILRAKRAYFYDKHLYYRRIRPNSITSSTERTSDWLEISNLIIEITKDHGCYERYAEKIYNKKFSNTFRLFSLCDEKDKPDFFKKLKKDFTQLKEKNKNDEVLNNISARLKFIWQSGMECETYKEFELTVNNYDLKRQNKKLEKELKKYKEINDSLLNSTSWKVTKPLRKGKKLFK